MLNSMLHSTVLCKIADACRCMEKNEHFEYKGKRWDASNGLNIQEIIQTCDTYRYSGFKIITDNDSLYFAYGNKYISSQEQYLIQKSIFSKIFKDYVWEDDLSVVVGTKNIENQQSLQVIQKCGTKKFFQALRTHMILQNGETIEEALNLPKNFLPKLCQYQERTVRWLLKREKSRNELRHFFKRLEGKDDSTIVYKNILCTKFETVEPSNIELATGGILADEMGLGKTVEMLALILLNKRENCIFHLEFEDNISKPKKQRLDKDILCICTKISVKTQFIECSMCHMRQHERCVNKHNREHIDAINQPYICPRCWRTYTETCLIESAATLIVTPNTIKKQWVDEIYRHTSPQMRLFVYDGISNGDWISPRQLGDYDVVLTDYSILKREVFHTSEHDSDRVMRNKPRSMRVYTPLLMINWFRVCLDEAQMVESNKSQMAALVRTLPAVHRWAVSGTPIQRSIDDLYPLIRFIGLEESLNEAAWHTLANDFMMNCDDKNVANCLLIDILRNFMWRTCKEQVLDELPIPPQTEMIHSVTLSDLERLFYTEQHEKCVIDCNTTLSKYFGNTDNLLKTSHQIMNFIMTPLWKIRQCCTIPVVSNNTRRKATTGVLHNQFLQPKELHAHMKLTNENECKSELRSMASSYNGCAAIHFIKGNYIEAVRSYEAVLKLEKDHSAEKNISVDSLLQIHALYNIFEARNMFPELALTIPEEKFNEYKTQLNALEWKYLEPYASQLLKMETAFLSASNTLETNMHELNEDLPDFMSIILDIDDLNLQSQLIAKILEECLQLFGSIRLETATSLSGILYMICLWHDKLMTEYKKILKSLEELSFYTANIKPKSQVSDDIWQEISKFISSVYDCHLMELRLEKTDDDQPDDRELGERRTISGRNKRKNQNSCKLCQLRDLLNNFECLLFKKSIDKLTNIVEGDENSQLEIAIIRIIFAYLKPKRTSLAGNIERHWLALQNMQQFCKKAIKYWIEIEFTVKAYDELDMCKMRITLCDDIDNKSNYKLASYELDTAYAEQQQNLSTAQQNFVAKMARLKYIRHLESNAEIGPCLICQSDDEKRRVVLECGHQMCLMCYKKFQQYTPGRLLTCCVCRNVQNVYRINFLIVLPNSNAEEEQFRINGDFSSKIAYIVRLIIKMQRENANNISSLSSTETSQNNQLKILVFSQWESILQALSNAFHENQITCLIYSNVRTIENFKNPSQGITCLLMPLSKGCKGLNLIEATHVFFVEPVLNPSEEQQAIGRVHRFGQTRPTTVHRFIAYDTIEENIYKVIAGKSENWDFDNLTFENLCELFKLRNNVSVNLNDSITETI